MAKAPDEAVEQATLPLIPTDDELTAALALSMEERDAWKKTCEPKIVAKVDKWAKAFREKTFAAIKALSMQQNSSEVLEVVLDHVRVEFVPGEPHRDQYIVNEALDRFREQFKENLGPWEISFDIQNMLSFAQIVSQPQGEKTGVIRGAILARMNVA